MSFDAPTSQDSKDAAPCAATHAPAPSHQPSNPRPRDPQAIIEAIDFEIRRIAEERRHGGWTTRALQLAWVATASWILTRASQLVSISTHGEYIAIGGVGLLTALASWVLLRGSLNPPPAASQPPRIVTFRDRTNVIRPHLLLLLICCIATVLVVGVFLESALTPLATYLALAFWILLSLMVSLAFWASWTTLPIAKQSRGSTAILTVVASIGVLASLSLMSHLPHPSQQDAFTVYELSGGLAIFVALTPHALGGSTSPSWLATLRNLRHDLSLGTSDAEAVASRLRVILFGMSLQEYLQEDLRRLLESFSRTIAAVDRLRHEIRGPFDCEARTETGGCDRCQHGNTVKKQSAEMDASLRQLDERLTAFLRRLAVVASVGGLGDADSSEIAAALKDEMARLRSAYEGLRADCRFAGASESRVGPDLAMTGPQAD